MLDTASPTPLLTSFAPPVDVTAPTNAPLLTYALTTTPDPIRASPEKGASADVTIRILISNSSGQSIDCSEIAFVFAVGTGPGALASDFTGVQTPVPDGWFMVTSGGRLAIQSDSTHERLAAGATLVLEFTRIRVNKAIGITPLKIVERTSLAGQTPIPRTTTINLAKFPGEFWLSDLTANPSVVTPGGSTVVSWDGFAANYTLVYDAGDGLVTIQDPPRSYTAKNLKGPLPAMFTLEARITVPGTDTPLVVQRSKVVPVSSAPPSVTSFVVNMRGNGRVQLDWSTVNAERVSISGVTSTAPNGPSDLVAPSVAEYTLKAFNGAGTATAPVTRRLTWRSLASSNLPSMQSWTAGSNDAGSDIHVYSEERSADRMGVMLAKYDPTSWQQTMLVRGFTPYAGPDNVMQFVVPPSGTRLFAAQYSCVAAYDRSLKLVATNSINAQLDLVVDPTETRVYTVGFGGGRIFSADNLQQIGAFDTPHLEHHRLAISPDGRRLFAYDRSRVKAYLMVFDAVTGARIKDASLGETLTVMTPSSDGRELWAGGVGIVRILDAETLTEKRRITVAGTVRHIFFTNDRVVAFIVMDQPGYVELVEARTGRSRQRIPVDGVVRHAAYSAADGRVFIQNVYANTFNMIVVGVGGAETGEPT